MQVIVCNLQKFSNDQMVQIIDTDKGVVHFRKVDIENLPKVICALSKEYGIDNVQLGGGVFAEPWADEIVKTYNLNYGANNIEVGVIYV